MGRTRPTSGRGVIKAPHRDDRTAEPRGSPPRRSGGGTPMHRTPPGRRSHLPRSPPDHPARPPSALLAGTCGVDDAVARCADPKPTPAGAPVTATSSSAPAAERRPCRPTSGRACTKGAAPGEAPLRRASPASRRLDPASHAQASSGVPDVYGGALPAAAFEPLRARPCTPYRSPRLEPAARRHRPGEPRPAGLAASRSRSAATVFYGVLRRRQPRRHLRRARARHRRPAHRRRREGYSPGRGAATARRLIGT